MPAKSVLITFDDGNLDNDVYAFPTQKKLGLHDVIFLVTGWISSGPARTCVGSTTAGAVLPPTPNHG